MRNRLGEIVGAGKEIDLFVFLFVTTRRWAFMLRDRSWNDSNTFWEDDAYNMMFSLSVMLHNGE